MNHLYSTTVICIEIACIPCLDSTDAGNVSHRTNATLSISSTAFYTSHKLQCCRLQIKHSLIATSSCIYKKKHCQSFISTSPARGSVLFEHRQRNGHISTSFIINYVQFECVHMFSRTKPRGHLTISHKMSDTESNYALLLANKMYVYIHQIYPVLHI